MVLLTSRTHPFILLILPNLKNPCHPALEMNGTQNDQGVPRKKDFGA